VERFAAGEVRIGPAYESERIAVRAELASSAEQRRVALGADLVLVFESRETVRLALEESLRAERTSHHERIAAEADAFSVLTGGGHDLAATLYVDVADPVALAERLGELSGVEDTVYLEVAGRRVAGRPHPADSGSGAFHLLFALDDGQRAALLGGAAVAAGADHQGCRTSITLSADQGRAIGADLRG